MRLSDGATKGVAYEEAESTVGDGLMSGRARIRTQTLGLSVGPWGLSSYEVALHFVKVNVPLGLFCFVSWTLHRSEGSCELFHVASAPPHPVSVGERPLIH